MILKMEIAEAFKSTSNLLSFFNEVDKLHQEYADYSQGLIAGIESKLAELLDDSPEKQDIFLKPEIPKFKKEPKEKRESRAVKKALSTCSTDSTISTNDETFRRSSRIASKAKNANESIRTVSSLADSSVPKNGVQSGNNTYVVPNVSPSLSPAVKIRRTDTDSFRASLAKPMLDETVNTTDIKQPLGCSTPTDTLDEKEDVTDAALKLRVSLPDTELKTPVSEKRTIKGESVKKRVEEFEKRTQAAVSSVTKYPNKTPEKKKLYSSSKSESSSKTIEPDRDSALKGRCTRNASKVLQEKSANIKLIKEKGQEAQKKKEVIMKASAEETKRKREERYRKAAAQREAVEKEKLESALKLEKEKEEKIKLIQKQKEQKLKHEAIKKKQQATIKAAEAEERRKKEEAAKMMKSKETESKEEIDYGIDHVLDGESSDDEEKPKSQIPSWASRENRRYPLQCQAWLDKKETIHPWFYNEELKHPKLAELFSADVKTRARTSSAFWNTKVCFDESFPIY